MHMTSWNRASLAAAALLGLLAGCRASNEGVPAPTGDFFFPQGLLLDPRIGPDTKARYLLVANGNNDRRYSSGALVAVDLDAFFDAWAEDPENGDYGVYPWCDGDLPERCVLEVGSQTNDETPCRRLPLQPRIVECEEGPFFAHADGDHDRSRLLTGNFTTVMDASGKGTATPKVWLPVRGDPSIMWTNVGGACVDGDCEPPEFECMQGDGVCDESHRLSRTRNDPHFDLLFREPYNVLVHEAQGPSQRPLVFGTHTVGARVTIIEIDGLVPEPGNPLIIDQAPVFGAEGRGGFGLAVRPCYEDNAPSLTQNCKYPLVYASARYSFVLTSFVVGGLDYGEGTGVVRRYEDLGDLDFDPEDCTIAARRGPSGTGSESTGSESTGSESTGTSSESTGNESTGTGSESESTGSESTGSGTDTDPEEDPPTREVVRYCGTSEEIAAGARCAVVCESQVLASRPVLVPGLDPNAPVGSGSGIVFGDIAFADDTGNTLYVLQTNPGALIRLDTSLDENGRTRDATSGPPIEVCSTPSRMKLWQEEQLAFISCFGAALVYVVDLRANRVVDSITTGTGPHDMALDPERKMLYVANTLEGSVSVIHLDSTQPTRFQEIARIGLQEPFSE